MNLESMYSKMRAGLPGHILDFEVHQKALVAHKIMDLKARANAVILGHNYMEPALFLSVPDFQGDSLDLSRKAATTDADTIVFCGVRFMAETAKILSPSKTVLLPSMRAGCSLAASITAEDVRGLKEQYPGVPVVSYVNTYAAVKAESDFCCTSGNATQVVRVALNEAQSDRVIFLPDEYLARNVGAELGMEVVFPSEKGDTDGKLNPHGQMIAWKGRCEVHEKFTVEDVQVAREQHKGVTVLAHPECSPAVVEASDFAGSTNAMIQVARKTKGPILLLTECSMGDNIVAATPSIDIIRMCNVRCPHMAEITLEQTRDSLLFNQFQIEVPEEIRVRAEKSLRRMIEIG